MTKYYFAATLIVILTGIMWAFTAMFMFGVELTPSNMIMGGSIGVMIISSITMFALGLAKASKD